MWVPIIVALLKNIVVPEVMLAYKRAQAKKQGQEPTEAEVFAEFQQNILKGIEQGEAFLARTADQ